MDTIIIFPIFLIFSGAWFAALYGWTGFSAKLSIPKAGLFLSLFPFCAFIVLLTRLPWLVGNGVYTCQMNWLSSMGLNISLYLDSLSAFFALLITFIGTLVLIYAGQYFKKDQGAWRFYTYILLFMGAMLGLVMAGDVITLFVFWELTSIISFLLVAYNFSDPEAKKGAFKALFITGGGGIALLFGLLTVTHIVGDSRWIVILNSGEVLRDSPLYLIVLGLIALGAFTKSAQFPFHIWLPDAMSAPTPASAYLHSATMVKAGIYLMARMNPVLGFTEAWFWLLTLTGTATMLVGAVLALKQTDLKAILAYSTICQLGILMMMIGQDMSISYKALIIGILAHALYKSALFLVAGIVDHETGTRDITRLGGLKSSMPVTFAIASVAALSMAGLPPLFGFLAKETLLASALHPSLPPAMGWMLCISSILAGALMLAISGRFIWDTFLGQPKDHSIKAHDPGWLMLIAPALPAFLSLFLGQVAGAKQEAVFLANAASNAFGEKVKVSLALWHGLNAPLMLSIIAIAMGSMMFYWRADLIRQLLKLNITLSLNRGFDLVINTIDLMAEKAVALQQGKLRKYLLVILSATLVLICLFNGYLPRIDQTRLTGVSFSIKTELSLLRIAALFLVCGTSIACVMLKKDFYAILAFGASGLGVVVLMALEPATDVALVQIVVDVLLVIILVLALTRLPKDKLARAREMAQGREKKQIWQDAIVSGLFGGVVMLMSLFALLSRPRISELSPFFKEMTQPATGSTSIVGTILTDFRGLDTLFEIAVFGIAGIGILTLIHFTAEKNPQEQLPAMSFMTPIMNVLARVMLPLTLVIGFCDILYGHDQPGDGFTAGVIISIGIGMQYMVFGYQDIQKKIKWLAPSRLVAWGILLAILSGIGGLIVNGHYFSPVDFGKMVGLPLPKGIHLSSSMIFELAICITVVGSVNLMLKILGRPGDVQ